METLTSLDLDEAVHIILSRTRPVSGVVEVALADAPDRILAAPITAPLSLPPFTASAMDGYALRSADAASAGQPLRLVGVSLAGHPFPEPVPAGCCVRIFTGAALPDAADAVAIQENCRLEDDSVIPQRPVTAGENVRPAGHDINAGSTIMDAGRRLSAFDIGLLAAAGVSRVAVHARPCVGVLSTGDELRDPGDSLPAGAIFDANRTVLTALLRSLPVDVVDFGIVPDREDAIAETLREADRRCDVVITSGGVSVGDADRVRMVVDEIGSLELWRLNLKPGKPLAFGRLQHAAFFGLPGNPVSAIVTLLLVVRPSLEVLCGSRPTAPLAIPATLTTAIEHRSGREEFQRATYAVKEHTVTVAVSEDQGSNRLASFTSANCLIRIPGDVGNVPAGSRVTILPFRGLL